MANHSPLARPHWPLSRTAHAVAALALVAASAQAQETVLKPVTVTGGRSMAPAADVTGFGELPLRDIPVSATTVTRQQIEASGARRLADLTQFDASVSDAYNAPGYWDFVSIRGFTLDNRFNFHREGLPISAETSIPLDNKERVEILKGTSGIQAGTSAPGGLVNYVVKRPTDYDLREAKLEVTSRSSVLAAADLGGRFGADGRYGYRLNVAHEQLRPLVRHLDGQRNLVALATDWRIARDSLLEGEIEWSHKSQGSQAGFSLLGPLLPAPVDPRLNLNNQAWVQPTEFDAFTGTLRFSQALGPDWRWSAQLGTQRLVNDDFTAFPYGCSAEGNFDRFCSDGSFDYYDFRSENEKRRQTAATLNLKGKVMTGAVAHDLAIGLLAGKVRNRFQPQAFNFVGIGHVDGTAVVPEDPTGSPSTNRDERTVELSLQDAIRWNGSFTTWLGVRHTRLTRESVLTDGSDPTAYDQRLTTPVGRGQLQAVFHGHGVCQPRTRHGVRDRFEQSALQQRRPAAARPGESADRNRPQGPDAGFALERGAVRHQAARGRRRRCLRWSGHVHSPVRRRGAASWPGTLGQHEGRSVDAGWRRDLDRRQATGRDRRPVAQRQTAHQCAQPGRACGPGLPGGLAAGPERGSQGLARRPTRRAARRIDHAARLDTIRRGAALRDPGGRHGDYLDAGHRQPRRQAFLEGIAQPVRPCVPVPRRAAHVPAIRYRSALRVRSKMTL